MGSANIKKESCHHCGIRNLSVRHCSHWKVWTCLKCVKLNHEKDHSSCSPQRAAAQANITLTRFDGEKISLQVKNGQPIDFENHRLGTCIYFRNGMVLVQESISSINAQCKSAFQ